MEILIGKQGNQRMPITDEYVSRKHCKLTSNADGSFTLENLSQNGTFVQGRKIIKTKVNSDTVIQLGPNYKIKVADLLPQKTSATNNSTSPSSTSTNEYSLKPLKKVWEEYDNRMTTIQQEQKTTTLLRSASPMFTLGSGAIAGLARGLGWGDEIFGLTVIMTVIGLILMVYSFWKGYKDNSIDERKEATKYLQDHYLCPNPDCRHFVGMKDYNILRQDKNCPYCKCKYTDK